MTLLIAGVFLWSVTHLLPAALPTVRTQLAKRLGTGPYRGLFSLDIALSLLLIIFGWRSADAVVLYQPPLPFGPWVMVLMLISLVLFVGSSMPTNIKRQVRHPQMMAVVAWSVAHLLCNGDSRSVVMFGGLGIWALLEILFINRRDGAWARPEPVPHSKDLVVLLAAGITFAALVYFHGTLFGPALTT